MKKILILGDSTVQWIRPYRIDGDYTYSEFLQKEYFVEIVSKPGMTSKDALSLFWNDLAGKFYDLIIISIGINDLTPRCYPRWLWKINNNILVCNSKIEKIINFFYRVFTYSKLQTLCCKLNISRPWISKNSFKKNILKLQEIILKESNSKIVFLSLPMVSERVKNILPGIENNVINYKTEFYSLLSERTNIIDIDKVFEENKEIYNPEGIHYSAVGHKKLFEELLNLIEMELK
ncbi:SGNH/GDSL hydrolase family protein [Halarcobacter bivalviorum]|uniref:SGNH/GDSL hydrolase family protein n=1 Tax=Halarcobacter bivalviorum TaxID=663364 RepID=UPI00100AA966|nr:SGNH/GDSL hydrolase family protein [Halarcobacter bivalviorum]RXK07207.1 hypothetical protein CRU97_03615 [Halarcobacter bivalviorum]